MSADNNAFLLKVSVIFVPCSVFRYFRTKILWKVFLFQSRYIKLCMSMQLKVWCISILLNIHIDNNIPAQHKYVSHISRLHLSGVTVFDIGFPRREPNWRIHRKQHIVDTAIISDINTSNYWIMLVRIRWYHTPGFWSCLCGGSGCTRSIVPRIPVLYWGSTTEAPPETIPIAVKLN